MEHNPEDHACRAGCTWLELVQITKGKIVMAKPLRIGMIGYGFMGRAHSNGYNRVKNFFDLEYVPVLQAVAARDV